MSLNDDVQAMTHDVPLRDASVLVIDDEALFGKAVQRHLQRAGYSCRHVETLAAAEQALGSENFDLLLLDMRLPDGSGLDFLKKLRGQNAVPVIVMTAYGEVDDAVIAMKHRASDYLKKPLDLEELLLNVEKVLASNVVSQQLEYSKTREKSTPSSTEFLGDSPVLSAARSQVLKIATLVSDDASAPTVLITGETGTGKDVAARLLHQSSKRHARPFVHVDCAALPKDLIESELFGHVKGAFTHAVNDRTGLIEAAEDGVVFLDEIGEIPMELQAKLLAVLERRTLRRIGSSQERRTDAWIIAATNRNVDEMVADGLLRSDLYFRLNVLSIALPALRERTGDAVVLARHFAKDISRRYGAEAARLSPAAERSLADYHWPGNVRELNHVIERAVLLSTDGIIDVAELALPGRLAVADKAANDAFDGLTLAQVERLMIERAMSACDGNVSEAARRLGITRMAMRYRLQKYAAGSAEE